VIEMAQSSGEAAEPEASPRERIRSGESITRAVLMARLKSIDDRLDRIEALLHRLIEGPGDGPSQKPGA
jgi:hypothetical protein